MRRIKLFLAGSMIALSTVAFASLPADIYAEGEIVEVQVTKEYAVNPETDFIFDAATGTITGINLDKTTVTELVIPTTIGGVNVNAIGDQALCDMPELGTVVVPDTLVSIGAQGFARDGKLLHMTAYAADQVAEGKVTYTNVRPESASDVFALPTSLTSIAPDALLTCYSIKKFSVPEANVAYKMEKSIESREVEDGYPMLVTKDGTTLVRLAPASNQDYLTFPAGLVTIGAYSCEGSMIINGLKVPTTVTTIGDYAFYEFRGSNLKLDFEETSAVATIGVYAFAQNHGNITIDLPASVTAIGDYCFYNIQNPTVDISHSSITVLPPYCFADNASLHELTMPATLKEIGAYAFSGSVNIDTVNFNGETLDKIGSHAFEECRTLHTIEIPSGVTAIEDGTFNGCTNVATIILPDTVETIGKEAFKDCVTIETLVIPANVTYIANDSFEGAATDKIDTSKSDAAQQQIKTANLKKGYFFYVGNLRYKITSAVKDGNPKTANVTVYGTKNKKLKTADIKKTISYKVDGANGSSTTFKFKVTAIEKNAFKNCKKMTKVTIGANVTKIGANAFSGCKKLKTVKISSTRIKSIGKNAFKNIVKKAKITVPKKKKKAYKKLLNKAKLAKTVTIK